MELIKNLKRTLEDADEKVTQIERLNEALLVQNKEITDKFNQINRRIMALQDALCRCRDMIESLMLAGSPNQLEHDAKIYLCILEGLITNEVIKPYPDYATGPAAARKREKLTEEIRTAFGEESK